MLMTEAVGVGKGRVEGLGGGGKGEKTGGRGMIIGKILCLFLLQQFPLLLAPLSFSLLHD